MESKQTAVEWLVDKLSNIKAEDFNSTLEVRLIIQQAKEMEKEQKGYSEEEVLGILRKRHSIKKLHEWFLD